MKIITAKDAIFTEKPEGTAVHYYLFDEYEMMYNDQAPHTTQTWHHHEKIWETLYMIDGQLTAKWRDGDQEKSQKISAGDVVETERTPHTFINDTDEIVRFIVLKRMPTGENHRDIFKNDKVLD